MRETAKIVLALLAGVALGGPAISALRAQPGGHPAYVVAEMHVTDPAGFIEYVRREGATLGAYHGRTLARALPDTREGTPPDGTVTILAFDNLQDANRWYNSPEYGNLIKARQRSATTRLYFLDGLAQ